MYAEFLTNNGQFPVAGICTGHLMVKNLTIKQNGKKVELDASLSDGLVEQLIDRIGK